MAAPHSFAGALLFVNGTIVASGDVCSVGSAVCLSIVSDNKFKSNIQDAGSDLSKLKQLQAKTWTWNSTFDKDFPALATTSEQTGFVAQDVQAIFPDTVISKTKIVDDLSKPKVHLKKGSQEAWVNATTTESYLAINPQKLAMHFYNGFLEQQREVDDLKSRVDALEGKTTPIGTATNGVAGLVGGALGAGALLLIKKK